MDKINRIEEEMKNQFTINKFDIKNLQNEHDYNINETHVKQENKISENKNEHEIKEKELLRTLEDQQKRIDYINERNQMCAGDKNRIKDEIKLSQLRINESDEKVK